MSALDRIVALAKAYERVEKGKLEHVGQYESHGTHPDDALALHEHLQMAELAMQRGDTRGAMESLGLAKEHVKAGAGAGNKVVHGVQHKKGKHNSTDTLARLLGKAVEPKAMARAGAKSDAGHVKEGRTYVGLLAGKSRK